MPGTPGETVNISMSWSPVDSDAGFHIVCSNAMDDMGLAFDFINESLLKQEQDLNGHMSIRDSTLTSCQ